MRSRKLGLSPDIAPLLSTPQHQSTQGEPRITINQAFDELLNVTRSLGIRAMSGQSLLRRINDRDGRQAIASFVGDSAIFCYAVTLNGVTIVASASGWLHFLRLE